jgi:hypothetical protein
VNPFAEFLRAVDAAWSLKTDHKIPLHVLGSTALFLQTDYVRGTKDGDVLQTRHIASPIRERLLELAGPKSKLAVNYGMYIDIVSPNIPMLPMSSEWHAYPLRLQHFEVEVLDIHDVVVSKLKRWHAGDRDDVRAMAEADRLHRDRLISRFEAVVDRYKFDGRADLLPRMADRLNFIERDWLAEEPTLFDFPEELFR